MRLRYKMLDAFHLKMIALMTMIIDHIGALVFPDLIFLRIFGRMAFIIYAFLITEGVLHTKNINIYIGKIAVWAAISEVPFDMAFHGEFLFLQHQNIFFTLLISVIGIKYIEQTQNIFLRIICVCLCCCVLHFVNCDYSWYGGTLIFSFYFFKKYILLKYILIQTLNTIATFTIFGLQIFAFIGFIPLLLYNGKKGIHIGDIYYSFYALHIMMICLIKYYFT